MMTSLKTDMHMQTPSTTNSAISLLPLPLPFICLQLSLSLCATHRMGLVFILYVSCIMPFYIRSCHGCQNRGW